MLPLLAPLLAVLLLAAFNPRPLVSVRLLTSRSPGLPLGVWLAAGGTAGALLSGLSTVVALRQGRRPSRGGAGQPSQDAAEPWFAPTWPVGRATATAEPDTEPSSAVERDSWPQAGPERGPGEPPPTVSVPFRVLRRPQRTSTAATARSAAASAHAAQPRAAGVETEAHAADDWDNAPEEDW